MRDQGSQSKGGWVCEGKGGEYVRDWYVSMGCGYVTALCTSVSNRCRIPPV